MRSPDGLFVLFFAKNPSSLMEPNLKEEDELWLLRFSELLGAYSGWLYGRQRHWPRLPRLWYATLFTGCAKTLDGTLPRRFGISLRRA